MAGITNATAQSVRVRLMQDSGPTGAQVVYQRLYSFPDATTATPMLSVTVTNSVVAGALNGFKMRVYNHGFTDMDLVVFRGNGSQDGDAYLSVRNSLGQEVNRVRYRGSLPGLMVSPGGVGYVPVPSGGYVDVPFSSVLVPEALAEDGTFRIVGGVSKIYNHLGEADEQIAGPLVGNATFSLVESEYYGTAQTDKANYANDDQVLITGQALRRSDDAPLPNTPLHIGFAIGEYRWFEDVATDGTGAYSLTYDVPEGISGEVAIWAAHPDVVDRRN
jgi:hypothetical protein